MSIRFADCANFHGYDLRFVLNDNTSLLIVQIFRVDDVLLTVESFLLVATF